MTKAVVLGGGGVAGIAWELGVVAGLLDQGVDVTSPDVMIGTSAGSVVGAQLAWGTDVESLFASQLTPAEDSGEVLMELDLDVLVPIFREVARDHNDASRLARVGAMALAAPTASEADRRAIVARRLPSHEWPERPLIVTAIDVESGAFTTFDRSSGVPLVDAIAASCAVPGIWPPVTIAGRRYMDGGVRSTTNVDLAAGHDVVLVVVPVVGFGDTDREVASLAAAGASVVVVAADETSVEAIGPNPLDPSRRKASAEAGRRQGAIAAPAVAAAWGGVSPSARR